MALPLAGIRVLELGNLIAGPFCGMLLGDMGADVIKIERPKAGDFSRGMPPLINGESASFAVLNRNKRSMVLDLKQKAACDIVLELAKTSHVFLENNRPGALAKMGLGAEHVRAVNPEIVYTSVSGFGQTGPYRQRAGVNLTIEAFAGTLSVTGDPNDMPMRPGLQTSDMFGALFAVYGVLAGLVNVLRNKDGRTVDVALTESSVAAAAWETAELLATGSVPQRLGHRHRTNSPYQLFATGDGRYIALTAARDNFFKAFMTVIGLESDLADPRFATYLLRKKNEDALIALVSPAVLKWKAVELEAKLSAAGVACSVVNDYKQAFDDPHMQARNALVEINHPRMGRIKAVRNPVLMDKDGPAVRRHAPMLAEHSAEILREMGYPDDRIAALAAAGTVMLRS
jgi:CoA:oxalate CoA-transferase